MVSRSIRAVELDITAAVEVFGIHFDAQDSVVRVRQNTNQAAHEAL
jgi:hypothetical protein